MKRLEQAERRFIAGGVVVVFVLLLGWAGISGGSRPLKEPDASIARGLVALLNAMSMWTAWQWTVIVLLVLIFIATCARGQQ